MMPYVKTALKGVRIERAERVLDVAYKAADKPSSSSSSPDISYNDGHAGL